eukprot:TRINITY_DN20151_c0_g1_i1.p1 TRINITY_DN20151_c0_g1~~TRINITY_DN20151_c0_g1_i1.p1  ORF type:complete len:518 (-),score=117.72 TRINITY_DN20151_c0_g1_i1:169-1629(-)
MAAVVTLAPAQLRMPGAGGAAITRGTSRARMTCSRDDFMDALGSLRGYEVVHSVGRGSFGTATLVRDQEGSLRVMKAIDIGGLESKQRTQAANEAKILASLKYPYIVRYREAFLDERGSTLAIVMDYAEGGDLQTRVAEARREKLPFSESRVLTWFTEAVLGLEFLHRRQILHRDLKSHNLFLSATGHLRIGDFGISKVLQGAADKTFVEGGCPIGSPAYLSPEVYSESLYSFASDVWALGCVLYELTALRLPFEAANVPALALRIVEGEAPAFPQRYSDDLRRIGAMMLAKDRHQRPSCSSLVKEPLLQAEVARLLREEQHPQAAAPVSAASAPPSATLRGRSLGATGRPGAAGSATLRCSGSAVALAPLLPRTPPRSPSVQPGYADNRGSTLGADLRSSAQRNDRGRSSSIGAAGGKAMERPTASVHPGLLPGFFASSSSNASTRVPSLTASGGGSRASSASSLCRGAALPMRLPELGRRPSKR